MNLIMAKCFISYKLLFEVLLALAFQVNTLIKTTLFILQTRQELLNWLQK